MSNELPWKRWTPDDLAPALSEFTPAVVASPEEGDTDVEAPELSEEEQRTQMLAQLQMQAHEQGFKCRSERRADRKAMTRVIRKVWRKG